MSEQLEALKSVAKRLDTAGVPHRVSGSVAMNFYAAPRMTRDIDIMVELMASDARRLRALFAADFYLDEDDIREAVQQGGSFNAIHNTTVVKLDFFVRKESACRKTEFERKRTIPLEGWPISVAAPEDLILSELHWAKDSGSEMQMRDVRNLIDSCPNLDRTYLQRWATDIGVGDLLGKAFTNPL